MVVVTIALVGDELNPSIPENDAMKLSEFELDVMQMFWEHGELRTSVVVQAQCKEKNVAVNTVKTIIARLEEKGAIERVRQDGKALVYKPIVSQSSIFQSVLPNFLKRFCGGSAQRLMANLLTEKKLTDEEVENLQQILKEYQEESSD